MASTSRPSKPEIAIIGAGLGGVTLSIGLARHGVPHKIYETAPTFSEAGSGLSMTPNALQALTMIEPRLRDFLEKETTWKRPPKRQRTTMIMKLGMAEMKGGAKFGDEIYNLQGPSWYPVGGRCARRDKLLQELASYLPEGTVQFQKSLDSIQRSGSKYELKFGDGSSVNVDAVIGCDGIKGVTKRFVLGENNSALEPVFTNAFAYRGQLTRDVAEDLFGEDVSILMMHVGYKSYFVSYPIDDELTYIGAVHKPDNLTEWNREKWVMSGTKEEMLKYFDGFGEPIRKALSYVENTGKWGMFEAPPAETFVNGRVCVVGDAAHATTPHKGSGAGMAFEDSFLLSGLLGVASGVKDIEAAFQAFDAVRRPRTQWLVRSSRAYGDLNTFSHNDMGDSIEKFGPFLDNMFAPLWDIDQAEELERARNMMRTDGNKVK